MIVALSVVAFVMVAVGLGLVVQGLPFTRLEWGWTMVLAGTVTAVGGLLLGGVAILVAAVRRVESALVRALDEAAAAPAAASDPEPPPPPLLATDMREASHFTASELPERRAILDALPLVPEPVGDGLTPVASKVFAEVPSDPPDTPAAPPSSPASEPAPPTVVGTYASGGNAYVMFSDGSIKADTPRGEYSFGSLAELKAFVAEGGEDNPPRPTT